MVSASVRAFEQRERGAHQCRAVLITESPPPAPPTRAAAAVSPAFSLNGFICHQHCADILP